MSEIPKHKLTGEQIGDFAEFCTAMASRLAANSHKTGWSDMTLVELVHLLSEVLNIELDDAAGTLQLKASHPSPAYKLNETADLVIKNATDIANYAMMIAANARRLKK